MALAQGDWRGRPSVGLLIAFSLGAMLSGLLIQDSTLQLGRRYGVALALSQRCCWWPFRCSNATRFGRTGRRDGLRTAERDGHDLQRRGGAHHPSQRHVHRPRHRPGPPAAAPPLQVRRLTLSGLIISGSSAAASSAPACSCAGSVPRPARPGPADRPDRARLCGVPAMGALAALRAVSGSGPFPAKRALTPSTKASTHGMDLLSPLDHGTIAG